MKNKARKKELDKKSSDEKKRNLEEKENSEYKNALFLFEKKIMTNQRLV